MARLISHGILFGSVDKKKKFTVSVVAKNSRVFDIDEINFNNVAIFSTMYVPSNTDERNQFYSLFTLYQPMHDQYDQISKYTKYTKIK